MSAKHKICRLVFMLGIGVFLLACASGKLSLCLMGAMLIGGSLGALREPREPPSPPSDEEVAAILAIEHLEAIDRYADASDEEVEELAQAYLEAIRREEAVA